MRFPASTTSAGVQLARWIPSAPQTRVSRLSLGLALGLALVDILGGLVLVGGVSRGSAMVRMGNTLLLLSGRLWSGRTVLLRHGWLDGLTGVAIAGASSTLVTLLLYGAIGDFEHLSQIATVTLWTQCRFQGVLAGVVAVVAYGMAVQNLGAAGAARLPQPCHRWRWRWR